MKCDKRLAVAKEHKIVDREAVRVDCGEAGHYSGPGHYSDPASINVLAPPDPRPLFEPGPLYGQIRCTHTVLVGASEAKPLSSGWCENRKFGTSRLRNSFWYVAVAQYLTLYIE